MRRSSRTYKLRLSPTGVTRFLTCHCRLAHLLGSFIPYGATLHVGIQLMVDLDACDIVAELGNAEVRRLAGDLVHFVGAPTSLMTTTQQVCHRLVASAELAQAPPTSALYLVGLILLQSNEDEHLVGAYRHLHAVK